MKKTENALDKIYDRYIEEAAQADRLQKNTAKIIRNISIPVVSAAAIAGLCLGIGKLGVFSGSQGVELLPATSGNDTAEAGSASTTVLPSDIQIPQEIVFPSQIPLVQKTQADIQSIIFGSEFPDMLYADEEKAIFTDGIGGIYSFDLATEQITFAVDVTDSLELTFDNFPNDFGGDSWNGINYFAMMDGQICCSVSAKKNPTYTGKGESITEHYYVNTDTLTLDEMVGYELADYAFYYGLFEIPYGQGYQELGLNGAKIADTDEFVYIRNCTADIDLAPMYDMQLIELRRWSESNTDTSAIAETTGGGYFPFDDEVGVSAALCGNYRPEADELKHLRIMTDGTFTFTYDPLSSYLPNGTYEVCGDLAKLTFEPNKEYIVYRIVGEQLIPCSKGGFEPNSTLAELAEIPLTAFEVELVLDSTTEDTTMTTGADKLKEQEECIAQLNEKINALKNESADMSEMIGFMEEKLAAVQNIAMDLQVMCDMRREQLATLSDDSIKADFQKDIEQLEEEIEAYEQEMFDLQQEIEELQEHKEQLDEQLDDYASRQVRVAEYISRLCRGSAFDGEYKAPDFVNILEGEWFVSTYHGYDLWRGGMHYGIDIVADKGDPIHAADGGIAHVPDVGDNMFGGNGNTVVIQHDGGYFTVYAHTDIIHVKDGERVEQGQHIADVGNTGWSTGPHLHFEVYRGQTPVDPLTWSWFDGTVYSTDSAAYLIKQAFADNPPATDKPENLWYPLDTSYEFSMCPDYGNAELSFNGLQGVSINAMADGEVIYVGGMKYAEGSIIYIKQTDGFVAEYSMVDECIVKVGDNVKAGLKIGQVGEWIEFRVSIADSYTSSLNPDDIVFSTRCLGDDICGYPTVDYFED